MPFADQWEADPQSWNVYTYVGNNPTNATDPLGLWKQVDCDNGGRCFVAEDNDTWEKLYVDAGFGGGFLPEEAALLRYYFQATPEIVPGETVVDVSGFPAWRNSLGSDRIFIAYNPKYMKYEFDFGVGGGLRNVAKAASKGGLFSRFVGWLGFGTKAQAGKLIGSLNGLTQAERSTVQELLAQGKTVQIIPRAAGKTADFIIDGVITELKTLQGVGPNTVKNAIETASRQGNHILIDARNISLTSAEAAQQIHRAQGNIGGLQGRVTVLTRDGTVTY